MSGEQIKNKLAAAGYSIAEVARILGMTRQNLSQSLSSPDVKTGLIEKLSQSLNIPVSYFLEDVQSKSDTSTNGSHSSQAVGDGAMASNSEGVKECLEIIRRQQESIDKLVDTVQALSHSTSRTSRT